MKQYHIRFNTQHGDTDFFWRIFENGEEILAKTVKINVPVYDECTYEHGVKKWNLACKGNLLLIDGKALII